MNLAPQGFCPVPRCPNRTKGGPCPEHMRERRKTSDVKRRDGDHRALYRTHRWKLASQRNLALNPWCVGFPLGFHGTNRVLAQCTDHRKPAHLYPELFFDPNNHDSMCFDCNTRKGQIEGGVS